MYPSSLILNKENTVDVSADVLDLSIEIEIDKFKVSVYDKRDKYKFNVIRFSPKQSNIPGRMGYIIPSLVKSLGFVKFVIIFTV